MYKKDKSVAINITNNYRPLGVRNAYYKLEVSPLN